MRKNEELILARQRSSPKSRILPLSLTLPTTIIWKLFCVAFCLYSVFYWRELILVGFVTCDKTVAFGFCVLFDVLLFCFVLTCTELKGHMRLFYFFFLYFTGYVC